MGLKLGERKHFLVGLNHLATYSKDRLRSMNLDESELESLSVAVQNYTHKVIL
jgi:hypothetical protein